MYTYVYIHIYLHCTCAWNRRTYINVHGCADMRNKNSHAHKHQNMHSHKTMHTEQQLTHTHGDIHKTQKTKRNDAH